MPQSKSSEPSALSYWYGKIGTMSLIVKRLCQSSIFWRCRDSGEATPRSKYPNQFACAAHSQSRWPQTARFQTHHYHSLLQGAQTLDLWREIVTNLGPCSIPDLARFWENALLLHWCLSMFLSSDNERVRFFSTQHRARSQYCHSMLRGAEIPYLIDLCEKRIHNPDCIRWFIPGQCTFSCSSQAFHLGRKNTQMKSNQGMDHLRSVRCFRRNSLSRASQAIDQWRTKTEKPVRLTSFNSIQTSRLCSEQKDPQNPVCCEKFWIVLLQQFLSGHKISLYEEECLTSKSWQIWRFLKLKCINMTKDLGGYKVAEVVSQERHTSRTA